MERRNRSRGQPERGTRSSSRRISERAAERAISGRQSSAASRATADASTSRTDDAAPTGRSVSGSKRKRPSAPEARSRSTSPDSQPSGSRRRPSKRDDEEPPAVPELPAEYRSASREDMSSAPSAPPPTSFKNVQSQQTEDGRTYELVIVEQPSKGCAFGQQPLSRIPLYPPLIARLRIFDRSGVEITAGDDLPFLTCQVSLLTEDGIGADLVVPRPPARAADPVDRTAASSSSTRRRSGNRRTSGRGAVAASSSPTASPGGSAVSDHERTESTTAGPSSGLPAPTRMLAGDRPAHADIYFDLDNQRRLLFIFSEICIRFTGRFRLQLNLTRLPSSGTNLPLPSFALASAISEVFTVVERDEYAIPDEPVMVKCLRQQGVVFPGSENAVSAEARAP